MGLLCAWGLSRRSDTTAVAGRIAAPPKSPGTNTVLTQVVVRRQFFSWREVESPDYRAYITNLRDIGCPEQTIRDIIIADVGQLYARKRAAEVPSPDQEWWRSEPDTNLVAAASAKTQALETERRALLAGLLGPDWETRSAEPGERPPVSLTGPVLGELSPETKQAVEDVTQRSEERAQAYLEAQQQAGKTADPAELARLRLETRNELAKLLNPAQLEEFLLRYSQTAINLRQSFQGLQLTPDEFRKLFHATDSLDEQIELNFSGDGPGVARQRDALAKSREDAIKTALGPDRYQQYVASQLAQDPAYRDALAAVQQAGVSPSAVSSLYALNVATAQELARIQNDPTLTDEARAAQIKALQDQQQSARNQLLGINQAQQPPLPLPPPPPDSGPTQTHSFSPGETIYQIADQYGVTLNDLLSANPNLNFNQLTRGAQIKIPSVK